MHTPDFPDALRHLVRIAAVVASAPAGVVRHVMADAREHVDPAEVDELLLQSYLFAGFPRTLNALALWREVSGLAAPAADDSASSTRVAVWEREGERACRTVYGTAYDTLRANIRALHPALDQWMVVDGYGKVLSRPALDFARRELCIVAACAASQQEPQLRSHLRGALNCGATRDQLAHTLSALSDLISLDAMTTAREELGRLTRARHSDSSHDAHHTDSPSHES
jgi:4-carboxymuconolactone decarboxylase